MAQRTGIPLLLKLAQKICTTITKFTPIIILLFPTNAPLLAALSAANTACATLANELAAVREIGD